MLTGSIYIFAGSVAPSGFLICDGSAVSRTEYYALFETIGTTYGSGDGSTTFNIPNLTGKVTIGSSTQYPLGSTGGEETCSLAESEIPAHNHTVPKHGHGNNFAISTPVLSHTVGQPAFTYAGPGSTRASKTSSTGTRAGTSTATAGRSANAAVSNHAAASLTVSGSISDAAAFDTDSTGIGEGHNNMQPYLTMNYVIFAGES